MKNTKSLLALFLACMMVVSCFVVTPVVAEDIEIWNGEDVDTTWYNDSDEEFTLTTAAELAGFASLVNDDKITFSGKTVKLGADIYLNDVSDFANWSESAPANLWTTIGSVGSGGTAFQGTFDGGDYTVYGMYATGESDPTTSTRAAFFGYTKKATIKNVTIENAYASTGSNAAVLVAYADGGSSATLTFENVDIVDCNINTTATGGVGGFVGKTGGIKLVVNNCSITGSLKAKGFVGGILGFHSSGDNYMLTVNGFESNLAIDGTGGQGTSGMFGKLKAASIDVDNVTLRGTLKTNTQQSGGVVGAYGYDATYTALSKALTVNIDNLTNEMVVTLTASRYGGLIGYIDDYLNVTSITVNDTTVSGNTKGTDYVVGGISKIAANAKVGPITFDNFTVSGNMTGTSRVAGVIGAVYAGATVGTITVSNSTVSGAITGTSTYCSGLIGDIQKNTVVGDISVSGTVVSGNVTGTNYTSGILSGVGTVESSNSFPNVTITNTVVSGDISGSGYVAGFVSTVNRSIDNITFDKCAMIGSVTATGERAGGFLANQSYNKDAQTISFTNCYLDADITGTDKLGGFAGYISHEYTGLSVVNSLAYGSITATGVDSGALVGRYGTASDGYYDDADNEITLDGFYYDMAFDGVSPRLGTFGGWEDCLVYEGEDCTTDAFTTCVFYTPNEDATSTELGNSVTPNSIAPTVDADAQKALIKGVKVALVTLPVKLFADELNIWDGSVAESFARGTGTEEDPFVIETAAQLAFFGAQVTAGTDYKGQYVVLGANIQLNSDADLANFNNWATSAPALEWTPIGTVDSKAFAGTFDGDGYAISGMYIDNDNYGALFNCTAAATIKNLVVNKAYVNVTKNAAGILVAYAKTSTTTFDNVTVSGSELIGVGGGTGAFIGKSGGMNATFNDCSITGTSITASGSVGGFYGYHSGSGASYDVVFDGCYSNAIITSTGSRVGGLVGEFNNAKNIKVYNTVQEGVITGTEAVGGLVGRMNNEKSSGDTLSKGLEDIIIEDTTVGGSISGSHWIAGFVAVAYAPAKNISVDGCTVSASINESGSSSAAGMFAMLSRSSQEDHLATVTESITITDSKVTGSITSAKGPVGGLLGNIGTKNPVNQITIKDTVVSATISGYGGDGTSAAGFISMTNAADIDIINCGLTGNISTNRNYSYSAGFIGDIRKQSDVLFEGCYNTGTLTIGTSADASRTGGWLAHYDPVEENEAVGSITFRNCYSTMDVKGTDYVGGLVGQIWPDDITLTVENTVLLGKVEAFSKFDGHGIILGYNTTKNTNSFVTIKNVYYNTDTTTGIARLALFNGDNPVASGYTFYTPDADTTAGLTKQSNLNIVNFINTMNAAKNSDGSTPAWFSLKHTCESVTMNEENGYNANDTMTLACQKPGCSHFHIEGLGEKVGVSIRTVEPYGIRFGFRFDATLIEGEGEEINVGILLIPEDILAGNELTVNTAKVKNIKAAKCFMAGNKYYEDGAYTFAGVLTNIPDAQIDRKIVARAYIEIDGVIYYTDVTNPVSYADVQAMAE